MLISNLQLIIQDGKRYLAGHDQSTDEIFVISPRGPKSARLHRLDVEKSDHELRSFVPSLEPELIRAISRAIEKPKRKRRKRSK